MPDVVTDPAPVNPAAARHERALAIARAEVSERRKLLRREEEAEAEPSGRPEREQEEPKKKELHPPFGATAAREKEFAEPDPPGVYLPEFEVRSEVNVFVDASEQVHVTGGEPQERVVPTLV